MTPSRTLLSLFVMLFAVFVAADVTAPSPDPALIARYREMLRRDPDSALSMHLLYAGLSDDPVTVASAREVLLEVFTTSQSPSARFSAFYSIRNIYERGKLRDDGSFKRIVMEYVRSEVPQSDWAASEIISSVALIELTPEEFDELLSRTLTIDNVPLRGEGYVIRNRFDRRESYGSILLAALAIKGGPDAYPRIQEVIAEAERTRPDLSLYSDAMGPRILLGTGSPDAYRDMLRQCIESVEIGRPRKELRFLAGSLISKRAQYTPKEREQILALCRAAATNEGGIFLDHVRIGVIGSLTEVLEKGGPSVDPEVATILDDSRAFWSVPGRMPHTFKIDQTLERYRARRATAGLGS